MPDLTRILDTLAGNQLLLLLAAFLLAILGYALLKRLLKIALFVAVFLGTYLSLVHYLG